MTDLLHLYTTNMLDLEQVLISALRALEEIPGSYLSATQYDAKAALIEVLESWHDVEPDVTEEQEWHSYDPDC